MSQSGRAPRPDWLKARAASWRVQWALRCGTCGVIRCATVVMMSGVSLEEVSDWGE